MSCVRLLGTFSRGSPTGDEAAARRWLLRAAMASFVAVLVCVAFIFGRLGRANAERDAETLEREVRLLHVHRLLGVASHEAGRSNYANASAATSSFSTRLADVLRTDDSLSSEARAILRRIQSQRDTITAQLARADPAAAQSLASAYLAMNAVAQEHRRDRQMEQTATIRK